MNNLVIRNNKKNLFVMVIFILMQLSNVYSQQRNVHQYSNSFVLTLQGSISIGFTDYINSKPIGGAIGNLEYYFSSNSSSIIGLKLYSGWQNIRGHLNNLIAPERFDTEIFLLGVGLSYDHSISELFTINMGAGASYIRFDPKSEDGNKSPNNQNNLYNVNSYAIDGQVGVRLFIVENLSILFNGGIHHVFSDNLDDITAGVNNDFFVTGNIGFSYSLFGQKDSDHDGIDDSEDLCIDAAEDFDGFGDEDGCPDLDNDGDNINDIDDLCPNIPEDWDNFEDDDGCPELDNDKDNIQDHKDKCPDEPEDYDGFNDDDGCPDFDNDNDGILDANDSCTDEVEDLDGFEDEDGCPEYDNDGDGILDENDNCPNEPENLNGFKDEDGCPDNKDDKSGDGTTSLMLLDLPLKNKISNESKSIVIPSDITFVENSSQIEESAKKLLNSIVELIKIYPKSKWRIEGHMDNSDTPEMIKHISKEKANAMFNYFIAKGLKASKFEVVGLGDKYPIESNNTEYGRIKNRRVEVIRIK